MRVADSLGGVRELHALVASHLGGDDDVSHEVVVGIEKDRGLIVGALVAASSDTCCEPFAKYDTNQFCI